MRLYSSVGVYTIPLEKIVIGLGSFIGVGGNNYVPLTSTSVELFGNDISYNYTAEQYMIKYLNQCLNATSPFNSSSYSFYFDPTIIMNWYKYFGGIMIYDFQSRGTMNYDSNITNNNNDVKLYFSEVHTNRTNL